MRKKITDVFCDNIERMEPFMTGDMLKSPCKIHKMDHTHTICKVVRMEVTGKKHLFSAFLSLMNGLQEVAGYSFAQSKSLYELKLELQQMNERFGGSVEQVYCDNPRADTAIIKQIFGEHVQVFRDLFHVIQDISLRSHKSSNFFRPFMAFIVELVFLSGQR